MSTIEHRPARPVTDNWDWQMFAACRGLDVDSIVAKVLGGLK